MLTVENLKKSYGDTTLFQQINCTISNRDRIGLIGVNGTGKSSLLKILAGIDAPDSGTVTHPKEYTIEYLAQTPQLDPLLTVIEQIYYGEATVMRVMRQYEQALLRLEADPMCEENQKRLLEMQQQMDAHEAWDANTKAKTILMRLGINDVDQPVQALSGGQKKRVAIARALIQPADLLILDEPTNHLDNDTITWLENYLATYNGALLLVTHDRYFLNRVTNRIFELDKGTMYTYEGNYELFLEKKSEREEQERNEQQKHKNTLRRELAWLRRGARARSTKQKARIERIDDMQQKTFHTQKENVDFQVGSTRLGKQVIELDGIEKAYQSKQLITSFSYLITRGERLGIIGPNGSGKSTLLNIIAQREKVDKGTITVGETVKIGYYTQEEEDLDDDLRVIDYIKKVAQVIRTKGNDVITAEQMLERFLFPRPKQWTYIRRLSGGEKRRLYLLKVLMTEPNVLLLDEPTNDLDVQTLSVLEEYLQHFPGAVITVSHDRYFLDRVIDTLLVFCGEGKVKHFYGNYTEYLEKMIERETSKQPKKTQDVKQVIKKKKLSYKEQKEWESIEDEIMALEEKIDQLKVEIQATGSDFEQAQKLFEEQEQIEMALEEKMNRWEELSLLVEEME
ncbi:ABC-F family ATP-binding cassette domain-containing protein [Virgibacillus sp. W0430]|uniref:ABC-F family ATP-binding cassette domain-containing protein n=1 Tax=Virgibacillus sp. W0430 TaxID=3391580 RepID=UPI003F48618A